MERRYYYYYHHHHYHHCLRRVIISLVIVIVVVALILIAFAAEPNEAPDDRTAATTRAAGRTMTMNLPGQPPKPMNDFGFADDLRMMQAGLSRPRDPRSLARQSSERGTIIVVAAAAAAAPTRTKIDSISEHTPKKRVRDKMSQIDRLFGLLV